MRHKVVAQKSFTKGNKVRFVLRRIETFLGRLCEGDRVANGAEYDAVFSNVQRGARPAQRTTVHTAPAAFIRYAAMGSNTNQPWGYYAKVLGCSIRTLDEVSMIIARLFAHMNSDMMPARYALDTISKWLAENKPEDSYPRGV